MRKISFSPALAAGLAGVLMLGSFAASAENASGKLDDFNARPPIHARPDATTSPKGLTPTQIRAAYNLPATGGSGTVAIVDAYDNPNAEKDLNVFASTFGLAPCTTANGCFEKHRMASRLRFDAGWALESALDTQVVHTVAPGAKVLLVEAKSNGGNDLLAAIDYACSRADVTAISLSWGGSEFSSEAAYDARFVCTGNTATVFAASGDSGNGSGWPAVSPNVVSVGGTTLALAADGSLAAETAWSGSGGGASIYESLPGYQQEFGLAGTKRLTPDVAANADPASGYSVYDSNGYYGQRGWFVVGGTSGSTPLWAGIKAFGGSANNDKFYADAAPATAAAYFRDIVSGTNGSCGAACTATVGYDQVTGLGSPVTTTF